MKERRERERNNVLLLLVTLSFSLSLFFSFFFNLNEKIEELDIRYGEDSSGQRVIKAATCSRLVETFLTQVFFWIKWKEERRY